MAYWEVDLVESIDTKLARVLINIAHNASEFHRSLHVNIGTIRILATCIND